MSTRTAPDSAPQDLMSTVGVGHILRGVRKMIPDLPGVLKGLRSVRTVDGDSLVSIARTFQEIAAERPNAPFLRFHGDDISYSAANEQANRIAAVLQKHGVRRGDVVGVLLTNRPETVLAALAISKCGAIVGLLNHNQRGEVLDHSQGLLASRVMLVGAECAEAYASVPANSWQGKVLVADTPVDLRHTDHRAGSRPAEFDGLTWLDEELAALGADAGKENPREGTETLGKETAYYIFTSGTTGLPKASSMSNMRWMKARAGFGLSGARLRPDDVLFCPLPMYHNNALTVALGSVLARGATLAVSEHFSASKFWDQVAEARATGMIYIGEICRYLLNQPVVDAEKNNGLRFVIGNGLRPEIWDQFQQRFGIDRIVEFYAASECSIAFVNAFDVRKTAGYCPLSFAIVEVDEESGEPKRGDGGRAIKVGKGEVGLLLAKINDAQPFDGYSDPEATEKKIVRDAFEDGDAWFNSGDLMYNQGIKHAAFVDRLGDTFRWKGENVATTQVEGALGDRPEIHQAAVYGVQIPGADGRAGMAAVTLASGSEFDGTAIAEGLRKALPDYAVPLFIRIVDEVEHTSTYKSRKTELREQGYDSAQVDDPLYVLTKEDGYVTYTEGAEKSFVAN